MRVVRISLASLRPVPIPADRDLNRPRDELRRRAKTIQILSYTVHPRTEDHLQPGGQIEFQLGVAPERSETERGLCPGSEIIERDQV
jgi:hypothetical protein